MFQFWMGHTDRFEVLKSIYRFLVCHWILSARKKNLKTEDPEYTAMIAAMIILWPSVVGVVLFAPAAQPKDHFCLVRK